ARLTDIAATISHGADEGTRRLAAQQFLADLSAAYYDNPRFTRGTIVVLPTDWTANATINTVLLPGLIANPVLQPQGIERFFSLVDRSSPSGASSSTGTNSAGLRRAPRP